MVSQLRLNRVCFPALFLLFSFIAVAAYMAVILQFNFLQSDVLEYWKDSLDWQTPFNAFHVPGYPLAIAMARGITFSLVPPVLLMLGINLLAFLASALLVYQVIRTAGGNADLATFGMLLFGLWPFTGVIDAVFPVADFPAIALLLAGVYSLMRSRSFVAALFLGLSLVTHKAMWPFVGLIVIAELIRSRHHFTGRTLLFAAITMLPITLLWLSGSWYHHSFMWIISSNQRAELASRGILPIADGLVGTLFKGGLSGAVKSAALWALAAVTFVSLCLSIVTRYRFFYFGIALSVAISALFVILNQYEIWAAARFSVLIVIPLLLSINQRLGHRQHREVPQLRLIVVASLSLLLLTQFAFAWYTARFFYA